MGAKNLHLEHVEDEILNQGIDGGRGAVYFLLGLRDMLKGNSKSRVNMTVKWDGAPAFFCGLHPETKQFFIAKKSLFNKTPLYYTSEDEIKKSSDIGGDLKDKFLIGFKYLSRLSWNTILQGDLMFTDSDKKEETIDGMKCITFQPNTIKYAVQKDSELGKTIGDAKMGIVFHTTYTGGTIEDLSASFGANISSLGHNKDVWIDDAKYKDESGSSSMTAKESVELTKVLTEVGKQFHQIKKKDLDTFRKIQDTVAAKSAAGASYKTYTNGLIRGNSFKPTYEGYLAHFESYWENNVVGKVKQESTKQIKREIGEQVMRELRSLKNFLIALTKFQEKIVEAKSIIINALNRIKSIGTFVETDTGLKAVNPEGYVAIDHDGKAVKFVDRLEFSQNNFNATKNWSK